MTTLKKIKNQIKILKVEVKLAKKIYKEKERAFSSGLEFSEATWHSLGKCPTKEYYEAFYNKNCISLSYRHAHIAYSLLRGRNYKQIEFKIREGNEPSVSQVNDHLEEMCAYLGLETYPHYYPNYDKDSGFTMHLEEVKAIKPCIITKVLEKKRDDLMKEISEELKVEV